MRKNRIISVILISMSVFMSGCTLDPMPDLTEEQSSLIAEYVAGIVMKYDRAVSGLASDEEIAAAQEREAQRQANLEELLKNKEAAGQREAASGTGSEAERAPVTFNGIAEFYGLDGFSIKYMNYEIGDSYPPEDSEDLFFAMDATEGNKLLVLKFLAENLTGEDRELDFFNKAPSFRISVNGGEDRSALTTMLLDDMAMYKDTIPAGQSEQLVLIREITQEESNGIQSIAMTLRNGADSVTIPLAGSVEEVPVSDFPAGTETGDDGASEASNSAENDDFVEADGLAVGTSENNVSE